MTSEQLEKNWLSLRFWILRCVLPSALTLFVLLLVLKFVVTTPQYQNQVAVIFGFFMLYFVLIRGGHIFMIRSMHFDLKRTYGKAYESRLARMPLDMRRQNLGFRLARIKRNLIDSEPPNKR